MFTDRTCCCAARIEHGDCSEQAVPAPPGAAKNVCAGGRSGAEGGGGGKPTGAGPLAGSGEEEEEQPASRTIASRVAKVKRRLVAT